MGPVKEVSTLLKAERLGKTGSASGQLLKLSQTFKTKPRSGSGINEGRKLGADARGTKTLGGGAARIEKEATASSESFKNKEFDD